MDKGNTMITLDELMNEVKTYIQDPDSLALIEKAYRYAQGHHQGQFRLHPLRLRYPLRLCRAR